MLAKLKLANGESFLERLLYLKEQQALQHQAKLNTSALDSDGGSGSNSDGGSPPVSPAQRRSESPDFHNSFAPQDLSHHRDHDLHHSPHTPESPFNIHLIKQHRLENKPYNFSGYTHPERSWHSEGIQIKEEMSYKDDGDSDEGIEKGDEETSLKLQHVANAAAHTMLGSFASGPEFSNGLDMSMGIPTHDPYLQDDTSMVTSTPTLLVRALATTSKKRSRGEKKPIPDTLKDEKYYERRKRNNLAAKKSRDARKNREDNVAVRAVQMEKENAILRAQVVTLREEQASLRHLLLLKNAREQNV